MEVGFKNTMPFTIDPRTKQRVEIDPLTLKPIQDQGGGGLDITQQFQPEEKRSVGGFAKNILSSGFQVGKDIVGAGINVFNPNLEKNTVANLARVGIGAAELLIPGEQGAEKFARNVGQVYDERLGISNLFKGDIEGFVKKIGDTAYEDPIGLALDASIIFGGAGAVAKGAGAVSKSSKLARAGQIASATGKAIDPLRAAGKIASKARTGERVAKVGEAVERTGKAQGLRAIKASPTADIANFVDDIGTKLDDFQVKNQLYGTTDQIIQKSDDLIKAGQAEYNSLVRTGEKVPVKGFTDLLREKAASMKADNISPEINLVADALIEKAGKIDDLAGKEGFAKVDSIVDAKGTAFGRVNPTTLRDAAALNANKIAGGLGIEFLETFAEGSAAVGKQLQGLRAFRKIVKKRAGTGKGSKAISLTRLGAAGTGAGAGAIIPGIGPLVGAAAGVGVEAAASSPRVISGVSKGIQKVGQAIQSTPGATSKIAQTAIPAGVAASRIAPTPAFSGGQTALPGGAPTTAAPGAVPGGSAFAGGVSAAPGAAPSQPAGENVTGFSLDELQELMSIAVLQGSKATQSQLAELFEIESAFQERQVELKEPEKKSAAQLARESMVSGVGEAIVLLQENPDIKTGRIEGPFEQTKAIFGKADPKTLEFNTLLGRIKSNIVKERAGAALSANEERLLDFFTPVVGDSKQQLETKLLGLQKEFGIGAGSVIPSTPTQNTPTFSEGQSAF